MVYTSYSLYFFLISILFLRLQFGLELLVYAENESGAHAYADSKKHSAVDVGLILDLNSSMGVMAQSCISMAISDFYSAYPHYTTRLALHTNNSGDVLSAASAALDLLSKADVQAIIGPQNSNEAKFVAELGGKARVPIISFSVTSSSLSPAQTPYFIRTAVADSFQLKAITAIVQGFGWNEVVILYEDTESGNSFIPYLRDSFQEAHIQLPYMSAISIDAQDFNITKMLKKLMTMQTRVFLVHMTSFQLGTCLFSLADKAGMMSQGYAWIITDGLSNSLSSMDATTIESMEGVLGLRPYSPKSENLENFKMRWGKNFNIFGLWAYDTVWALALAVEKIQEENSNTFQKKNVNNDNEDACGIRNLGMSDVGPRLLDEILRTRFQGLTGEFKLENGQLETPAFEIINIVGNGPHAERTIGYWTPNTGISRKLGSSLGADDEHKQYYSTSIEKLKKIIWPGDSTDRPKGWDIPGTGKKLRVGVPKNPGFTEFVNVQEIGDSKKYNVTGFSIDVFKAALTSLPFELEPVFVPFLIGSGESAGSYDDLVHQLCTDTYDAVVGDTTIRAHRALLVDFSLPYSESGVVRVVKVEPDKLRNMWIFLMPLSWDLWLAIVVACIFVGLALRILERRGTPRRRELGMLFWFPLAALAFPERNMVANGWARFVLVVWLFTAYILMQSYTANLSSILTVGQLTPSLDTPDCAGYNVGSFVKELLLSLKFNESNLRSYSTMTEYDEALSKGCKNGGVDAIFDEIPYIRLFLHKYGSKYKMVGTTYSTGGFGFAFPSGSRLARFFSRAILDVMENGTIQEIEKNYFGGGYNSLSYQLGEISRNRSLTSYSFAGLFTIIGFFTILALVCSECSFALTRRDHSAHTGTGDHEMDSLGTSLPDHEGDSHFYDDDDKAEDTVVEGDQQIVQEQDHNDDNNNDDHGGDETREIQTN